MERITRPVGEEFNLYKHHPNMADTIVRLVVTETSSPNCKGCYLKGWCNSNQKAKETVGYCSSAYRDDDRDVVFTKVDFL